MPDNKPTDNEIIKALDICSKSTNGCSHSKYTCEDCYLNGQPMCSSVLLQDAIDYFNRLQAENERLEGKVEELSDVLSDTIRIRYAEAKAEAYKEFAERLERSYPECKIIGFADFCYIIDNLLKDLVGDSQ